MKPVQIYHSSIFTTSENTEIRMCVLMNTMLPVNEEKLIKEIIYDEQKINGVRKNPVYTLIMYRSIIHYRNDWQYDSFTCDGNMRVQ